MRGSRYAAEVDFEQAVDAPSAWLDVARAEWRRWSDAQAQRDLPWFARGVLRAGAFATFVGVAFPADAAESAWHAVACGDSCVFVVRDDRLEHAFPVTQSDAFDNTPRLVRTSPLATGDALRTSSGPLRAGDAFYLVTDALAQWFLSAADRGGKPWQTLDGVITPADLDALVTPLRASHVLRNDDVTLVSVVVAADA
jgi:hypothetical protein